MKEKLNDDIFTPAVKKRIDTVVDRLGMRFFLDPFGRSLVKVNIMKYVWCNSKYYDPQLSAWDTFACLVVTSGERREMVRLTEEAKAAQSYVPLPTDADGNDELPSPDTRCGIDRMVFAMDLADVLARMPASTASILYAVVVEGLTFAEASKRFGYAPKAFYRRVWPRVRKDFLRSGGEFFRVTGQ